MYYKQLLGIQYYATMSNINMNKIPILHSYNTIYEGKILPK